MLFGYVEGYSDPDEVEYCPYCGGGIDYRNANGFSKCSDCGRLFAVIEGEEE